VCCYDFLFILFIFSSFFTYSRGRECVVTIFDYYSSSYSRGRESGVTIFIHFIHFLSFLLIHEVVDEMFQFLFHRFFIGFFLFHHSLLIYEVLNVMFQFFIRYQIIFFTYSRGRE
jgi:hypothetical protein